MTKRFGDRSMSMLTQEEADGALSAPEMPNIRRDRGGKTNLSLRGKLRSLYGVDAPPKQV